MAVSAWLLVAVLLLPVVGALASEPAPGVSVGEPIFGATMGVDVERAPDGSLYVAELWTGHLRVVRPNATEADETPLWTAPGLQTGVERGFAGLALAHDFEESGAFYVFYTHNASGLVTNRLSRVQDGVETPILWDLPASTEHNGGRILTHPDGTLLLAVGDTNADGPPSDAVYAHDPEVLAGKVLRMLPDGSPAPDNPWGNLVWTKGHRNVYGLAVAPDGTVFATENGPEDNDELNLLVGGRDYGWPTCSGFCDDDAFAQPLMTFTPTVAPVGAAWHDGAFYFAGFNDRSVHRVRPMADGSWGNETVLRLPETLVLDLDESPGGLVVLSWGGIVPVTLDERWSLPAAPFPPVRGGAPPVTAPPEATTPASPSPQESVERVPALPLGLVVATLTGIAGFLARRPGVR